jgi:hypothetical protein
MVGWQRHWRRAKRTGRKPSLWLLNTYRPPDELVKALVRHWANPGVALAGVLGWAPGIFG